VKIEPIKLNGSKLN